MTVSVDWPQSVYLTNEIADWLPLPPEDGVVYTRPTAVFWQ